MRRCGAPISAAHARVIGGGGGGGGGVVVVVVGGVTVVVVVVGGVTVVVVVVGGGGGGAHAGRELSEMFNCWASVALAASSAHTLTWVLPAGIASSGGSEAGTAGVVLVNGSQRISVLADPTMGGPLQDGAAGWRRTGPGQVGRSAGAGGCEIEHRAPRRPHGTNGDAAGDLHGGGRRRPHVQLVAVRSGHPT